MNRTDRLYALVEELRAISPRCRSARELAVTFEVSVRTIERDISALQRSGVPISPQPGRRGGYVLDEQAPPAPLGFTPAEAAAVVIALGHAGPAPYARHARSASRKVVAALSASGEAQAAAGKAREIGEALLHRRVLRIGYRDRNGAVTSREIEPGVFLGGRGGFWYLVGWCRLREDVRVFRLDRIIAAGMTAERCPERPAEEFAADLPDVILRDPASD